MNHRRVVVTGMGAVTPLAHRLPETWRRILLGHSGVRAVEGFDTTEYACKIWADVRDFCVENYIQSKDARKMDPFTQYGMVAADEALRDAGLIHGEQALVDVALSCRAGVAVGAGIGGIQTITHNQDRLVSGGARRVSPFLCLRAYNMVAGQFPSVA